MKRMIPRQQSLIGPEIQNPFYHKLHLSKLDLIKIALMSVTIAPLRLLLCTLCLLIAWPLAAIAVSFRSPEDESEPLTGWRKWFELPVVCLGRLVLFLLGLQAVKVRGEPAPPSKAPVILAAPHSSYLDAAVIFYCACLPAGVSRAENKGYPLISALVRFTQPVFVKREDPNSRQNTIEEIKRRAASGGKWPQIIIFPEGTCTNRTCLISYKLGAFYPGVPIQPVCIRYPNKLDTVTWTWEGPGASLLRPVVVFLCRCVFFIGGFHWISVKGKRAKPEEAAILALAPHSSYLDALPAINLDLDSVVAKFTAQCVPLFGTLVRFTQPVFVKREDPNSRQNTIEEIKRRAASGGKWPQIIIFPEGTCTNRSCLISYKLGAFYPGVPIQPVCIKYPNKLDTVTWTWEGPGALALLWLTLCQFNTNLEIEFLPVYTPSEEEKADAKLFANNVRKIMAKALGVPVTDHTFDDCRLMMDARKLNLPMDAGLVEFQKLHQKLGVSLEQLRQWLADFGNMDLRQKGHVTIEEFSQYLQVPESESLMEVFSLYDRDGSGSIDFREYVIGLSLVSQPANTESTISLAFQMFGGEKDGYIRHEDLHQILHNAFGMTEVDTLDLFSQVDQERQGRITYDEFKAFAEQKPEYAPLFLAYHDMREANSNENASLPTVLEETGGHAKSE